MGTYEFRRVWTTPAPVERVHDVLDDLERYPEWWRQVVAVAKIDDDTARVLCRSALPYTLDLVLHSVRRDARLLEVRIEGDLSGWSRFALTPVPGGTHVAYEQHVVVAHRSLAIASALLRPLLLWNHDHMMAGCEAGLRARTA